MCAKPGGTRIRDLFPLCQHNKCATFPPKKAPLYDSSVLLASGEDGDQPYLLDVATGEEEGQSYMLSTRRLSVQCGVVRSEGAGVDVVAAGEGTR